LFSNLSLPAILWNSEDNPCRIVNEVIEKIDVRPINRKYKGGGAFYHTNLMGGQMIKQVTCTLEQRQHHAIFKKSASCPKTGGAYIIQN